MSSVFLYIYFMKNWTFLVLLFIACSCQSVDKEVDLSVYYWKTQYELTPKEVAFLDENQVNKLYVRYCDVGLKNDQPIPIAPIEWKIKPLNTHEIVPVIYIKNEVFLKPHLDIEDLVRKLELYIHQINTKAGIQAKHIQFDCDWSLQSKEQFFEFLKQFKQQTNTYLSATIRLHQIKYFEKTGIPPVDHGVLMYYNMGTIAATQQNSIYDRSVAQKYVRSLTNYPMHLDIALPVFSWGVHTRNGKIVNVIGGLRTNDFDTIPTIKKSDYTNYVVEEDYLYKGRLLLKDDVIKIEEVSSKALEQATKDLSKSLNQKPNEIIIYDLDSKNLESYEKEIFKIIRQGY